jgi:hypothetical protein
VEWHFRSARTPAWNGARLDRHDALETAILMLQPREPGALAELRFRSRTQAKGPMPPARHSSNIPGRVDWARGRILFVSSAAEGQAALHNANDGAIETIMRRCYLFNVILSGVFKTRHGRKDVDDPSYRFILRHPRPIIAQVECASIKHVTNSVRLQSAAPSLSTRCPGTWVGGSQSPYG